MPVDRQILYAPYEDVRDDKSETTWAQFVYEGKNVVLGGTGTEYAELISKCADDARWVKFVFLTWVGQSVGAMAKAKMSTDKADIKMVCKDYAIEVLADDLSEVQYDAVLEAVKKVGGANYGTGVRD